MTEMLFELDSEQSVLPQTIKYMGSKRKIAGSICSLVRQLGAESVFDAFSGSTYVAQYLARAGMKIHANDIAEYSLFMNRCFLLSEKEPSLYQKKIDHLNALEPLYGWFSEHYGGNPKEVQGKRPWQLHNTMKLDAIREEIDSIADDEDERAVLVTSLILALDKVDNTLGHYAAYLNKWSPRSFQELRLELPNLIRSNAQHRVTQASAFDSSPTNEAQVAYFDPPYGSNNEKMPPSRVRYAAYYHIWKTVCLNDKPKVFGVNNRREDSRDSSSSVFESYKKNASGIYEAVAALEDLIAVTPNEDIILSYSSGGRATRDQLLDMCHSHAKTVRLFEIEHRENVMKHLTSTGEFLQRQETGHYEYLIALKR